MASKFEHMGYIGVAVINDTEREGRTLTRVFASPNPPKDYLKQRNHTGAEEWTIVYDELIPNLDGKFGALEFINTNKALVDLAHKDNTRKSATDAYFRGDSKDIINLVKSSIRASTDALIRHESVLATQEQLSTDSDFKKFAAEKLKKSGNELLFSGQAITDTKIIDTVRVLKESKYPLTLAAITKSIYGKNKDDYIKPEEKERTKDILNILTESGFLQMKEYENVTKFSAYPAFKIAQLKLLSQSIPSLNIMGQLGYLFDPSIDRPNEKTDFLNDPELEKKERIARINERVNAQMDIYLKSDAFEKEKDMEFIQGVKNLISDFSTKLDITTKEEAHDYYNKNFSAKEKDTHKESYKENIRDILLYRKKKIMEALLESSVLQTFNNHDVENAKKLGNFNVLESNKAGYVYILYNKESRIFKVGETSRSPQGRANELSANLNMPGNWQLARGANFDGYVFTEDRQLLEAMMHARFKSERFNKNREFFRSVSQTDDNFFKTLSSETIAAKMATREYFHSGKADYPFLSLAKEELEQTAKSEQFKNWKEEKERQEEAEFFKITGNNINNRNIEPIKNGVANPDYDNPLFVPLLQILHYNSGRKDMSNNLRTNPRTRDELKEQLNIYFPELSAEIKNENIQNALDLMKTIEPPIIRETIRSNSNDTQMRFIVSSLDDNLMADLNDRLPKLALKENISYMLNENLPEEIEKKFIISTKTPILMGALKVDKTNKSLQELSNELRLFPETIKDIMEGLQKEVQNENVFGHKKAIFVIRAVKGSEEPEMYGGNLKFTKSHIEELERRYPDAGFENIKKLFNEDNPKELNNVKSNHHHLEIKVPVPTIEPMMAPDVIPEIPDIPLSAYEDMSYIEDSHEDEWLNNIPEYPNPIHDEEMDYQQPEHLITEHDNFVLQKNKENDHEIDNKELSVKIIELLKRTGSPALQDKEKRTSKKTLSPEEISSELKVDIVEIKKALDNIESKQMNPLYVRDFEDRKVYGMNYKIEQEDLLSLGIFDTQNIEHRKVLSLFNNTNPNSHYSNRSQSDLANSAKKASEGAEKFDVAEKHCPKALRDLEEMMPTDILDQLRKIAAKDPQAIIEWLKDDRGASQKNGMKNLI